MKVKATRYHDISCGHRVYGHESKCAHLHGHNYRIHFTLETTRAHPFDGLTDAIGRVLDFSAIKSRLCEWLESNWDHRFLVYIDDPWCAHLIKLDPEGTVRVSFNPTAENMAQYLLEVVAPAALAGTGTYVTAVRVEETRKCAAEVDL